MYLIQAFVEIQRRCHLWYMRMRDKIFILLSRKLQSSRIRLLSNMAKKYELFDYESKYHNPDGQLGANLNHHAKEDFNNNFLFDDLNQVLIDQNGSSAAVSIPMPFFLLPLFVQPSQGGHHQASNVKSMWPYGTLADSRQNQTGSPPLMTLLPNNQLVPAQVKVANRQQQFHDIDLNLNSHTTSFQEQYGYRPHNHRQPSCRSSSYQSILRSPVFSGSYASRRIDV